MYKSLVSLTIIGAFLFPSVSFAAKLPSSEFSYAKVKVGQKVGGMKVTKIERNIGETKGWGIGDMVYFSGVITLSGDYDYSAEDGMGCPLTITLDKTSLKKLPHAKGEGENAYLQLDDCEKGLKKIKRGTSGKMTFIINKLLVSPPAGEVGGHTATLGKITKVMSVVKPETVVRDFYRIYIQEAQKAEKNPEYGVTDKIKFLKKNKNITNNVINLVNSAETPGGEPIYCGQDTPQNSTIIITNVTVGEKEARVFFQYNEDSDVNRVNLKKIGSAWKVDGVECSTDYNGGPIK